MNDDGITIPPRPPLPFAIERLSVPRLAIARTAMGAEDIADDWDFMGHKDRAEGHRYRADRHWKDVGLNINNDGAHLDRRVKP